METEKNETDKPTFKKPVFIGKIGKLPKKLVTLKNESNQSANSSEQSKQNEEEAEISVKDETDQIEESTESDPKNRTKTPTLDYNIPSWAGLPTSASRDYAFEVLKSGVIIDRINLMSKPFWVIGRITKCDIPMSHPTVSRHHAVLVYRKTTTDDEPPGFYIYDLNSSHGTFLNKNRIKSRIYAPLKVGHMLKIGCSSRSFILTGPDEDAEAESELSVTELKRQRAEHLLKRELEQREALLKEQQEADEKLKREEERGIDWGLGEDADEEADLRENPYAQTNNEELYIEDPKKALRGFMEREGHNLEYDCSEQGYGQFLCKVELPLDDDFGKPIVAEVLHKGKKKEAVVQCALEACKILDRYGVLRQATHESRKRKAKNWEENDYYDSDDDTFLDRTGTIEKKREKRMQSKLPPKPETYQSLIEKEKSIGKKIRQIQVQLRKTKDFERGKSDNFEEDSLDSFMKDLKQSKPDRQTVSKMKAELIVLKKEYTNVVRLANLAKPTDLPALVVQNFDIADVPSGSGESSEKKSMPFYGKRSKIKVQLPAKTAVVESSSTTLDEEDEEESEVVEKMKVEHTSSSLQEESIQQDTSSEGIKEAVSVEELERRKKKNQRRLIQRKERAEMEKQKGYEEDALKEDYNMWVPPVNQTGDGKTSLNEKFGY